jgi:hypothetical protein
MLVSDMKKFAALLTLLFWSINTAASASTVMSVLCVEKNGVVSIEYSLGAGCVDTDALNASTSKTRSAAKSESCPSCVDSYVGPSIANSSPRVSDKAIAVEPLIARLVVFNVPVFTHPNGVQSRSRIDRPSLRYAYLIQRQSIVILQ